MRVAVVGAGIIGASAAWHLARRGADVTIVEEGLRPGGLATPASFSWINASHGNPRPYFDLRMRSIEGWRKLSALFPEGSINLCGGLFLELEGAELEASVRELSSWGYDIRLVDEREIRRIEPGLARPPAMAAFAADEGMVESEGFARLLVEASGATVLCDAQASAIRCRGARVTGVETSRGLVDADAVLVACGAGAPALLASAGFHLPIDTPAGLLIHTHPSRASLRRLVTASHIHARQRPDGCFLAGADFLGSHDIAQPQKTADMLLDSLRELTGDSSIELARWTIGHRPTPSGGFPATGPVPGVDGLFVAVTHSGVTLAPALGEMAAGEIAGGDCDPLLAPYRAARFAAEPAVQP